MAVIKIRIEHVSNEPFKPLTLMTNLVDTGDDSFMISDSPGVIPLGSSVTSLGEKHNGVHTYLVFTWDLVNGQVLK